MQAKRTLHFFEHEQMDFEVRAGLGGAYYGSTDPGEMLATIETIEDGNFESWFTAFQETGDRIRRQGDRALNPISRSEAYLRAANYYGLANVFIDGTEDISRQLPTWQSPFLTLRSPTLMPVFKPTR